MSQQYRLLEKDREYRKKTTYLPVIPWYCDMAAYREFGRGLQPLANNIRDYIVALPPDSEKLPLVWEFLDDIKGHLPEVFQLIKSKLHEKGQGAPNRLL